MPFHFAACHHTISNRDLPAPYRSALYTPLLHCSSNGLSMVFEDDFVCASHGHRGLAGKTGKLPSRSREIQYGASIVQQLVLVLNPCDGAAFVGDYGATPRLVFFWACLGSARVPAVSA